MRATQPPAAMAKIEPIAPAQQALRTTLPAMGAVSDAAPRGDAGQRAEPANARSIEGWGARKAAPAAQPVAQPAQPAPAPAEAASSAQGHRRLLAFVGNSGEAIDILSSQQALLGKHRDCDDTNLGRLLEIYTELRASSQLLVITHQKRTMEVADSLYGVTMRADGVSTVISQRLREA